MSSTKPESFQEFLSRRKLSSPQAQAFESELNPDSITKTFPNENPENNNSSKKNTKNKDSSLKMKNSKSSKETKKAVGSNEIKEKNIKKNEELRILKFQAMEKERLLEKRKKAVVMIQKLWRGFVQFCKFQAFKYVCEILKFEFFLKRIVSD